MNKASVAALVMAALALVFAVVAVIVSAAAGTSEPQEAGELAADIRALEARFGEIEKRLDRIDKLNKLNKLEKLGNPAERIARPPAKPPAVPKVEARAVPEAEAERLPWNRPDVRVEVLTERLKIDAGTAAELAKVYRERQDGLLRVWREAPAKRLPRYEAMRRVWSVVKEADRRMAEILTPEQLARFRMIRKRDHPRGIDFPQPGAKPHHKAPAPPRPEPEPDVKDAVF
jgi:hypothetical protein